MFLLVLAGIFAWGTALENQQQNISNGLIRLHVVADSDQWEDQQIKLLVRDAVLEAAEPMLSEADSVAEAKGMLELSVLEAAANSTLEALGSDDIAVVTLERELFGTRHYDGFSLPGGYYDALRVTIGSGEGKNWWCVVYPQLCMAAVTEEQYSVAVMGGISAEDMQILQMETPEYELKFKTLEVFENIMGWFRSRCDGIPTSE